MILQGDCLEKLKELEENSVDSIVTDPPYELGFMGKSWDNTGIANDKNMWAECLRVLKPGGHLLAFSGTRTYHRMAVAIEDAGFEVRDMIEWCYGSGFPKSLSVGKAVDKLQGNEREKVGDNPNHRELQKTTTMVGEPHSGDGSITKGTSPWEGWGTALKPAHEPICMARKPLAEKTVAENVLKYGTGGINIDESRVEANPEVDDMLREVKRKPRETKTWEDGSGFKNEANSLTGVPTNGRFPANLIHDNSEEVRECFPNESERFFKSIIYQAKASKSERNRGLENREPIKVNDGRQTPIDNAFQRGETPRVNIHPTIKPIALMEYLIKMITPKGGTVLDPFMGSGSTGVACEENGFDFIGIELEEEYIKIAEARIKAVQDKLF